MTFNFPKFSTQVYLLLVLIATLFCPLNLLAQLPKTSFIISMPNPAKHLYHVELSYRGNVNEKLNFYMPVWTPGFYSIMNYASAVSGFKVIGRLNKPLKWSKTSSSIWQVVAQKQDIKISYDVKANDPFIANINLTEDYGYIIPGAMLLYTKQALPLPVTLQIKPYAKWPTFVATGLHSIPSKVNVFHAANFDELYDSPLLMGRLEALPVNMIKGIPHQFIGNNLGDLDRNQLAADLKKIFECGSEIIGEIPYKHYTFLAVGTPASGSFGGIEHLNSASLIIGNKNLLAPKNKIHFYTFLAHEYFHAYNVKRIRPIALGPFDYSKENYTNLLWVSEGFTVYYENIITRAAKLITAEQMLYNVKESITNYENKPGHLYQSASASSRAIWEMEGNPNNRDADALNKTISVYDKGCALGLMLDLKIRNETQNRSSLDNLMRVLYHKYYRQKNRGFTDDEFRKEAERIAGVPLDELFSYANTTVEPNYPKYFAYAGLAIDTAKHAIEANNLGIYAGLRNGLIVVRSVSWPSPAWSAGLQPDDEVLKIDGAQVSLDQLNTPLPSKTEGDQVTLQIKRDGNIKELRLTLKGWYTRSFDITPLPAANQLQIQIYNSWMRN